MAARFDYQSLRAQAEDLQAQIVEWRRLFHRNAELSFREHEAAKRVADSLRDMGLEVSAGWARAENVREQLARLGIPFAPEMGGTGVVAELQGALPGPTVALRADMDALPLSESDAEDHVPARLGFASRNPGVMHACGHDAHTAMLLGAARLLVGLRETLSGRVRFIFQPAEELGNGAEVMVKEGVLRGAQAIFGTHVWALIPAGRIAVNAGPVLASSNVLKASFRGGGGHGSVPHETTDPLLASCEFVTSLYRNLRSRMDARHPATVTVTRIDAGHTWNVIPSSSEMEGTFRVFDADTRTRLLDTVRRTGESVARFHELAFEMGDVMMCPPTTNEPAMARTAREAAERMFGKGSVGEVEPSMGGEDFSYYLREVPGAFMLVGARNEKKGIVAPHHNPRFDIDEEVLCRGAAVLAGAAVSFLEER